MFGLLGKKLSHSFSKQIHEHFGGEYQLFEVDDLEDFIMNTPFNGLNITIPYKQDIIQFCDVIDPLVTRTNSCNTIVKKNDMIYAYNTDYEGFLSSIKKYNVKIKEEIIAIIGNGATSRTGKAVVEDLGAKEILVFARHPKNDEHALSDLSSFKRITIIINTTPVGMFPNIDQTFDFKITSFPALNSVLDVVYNPLYTHLLLSAKNREIITMNGLYMLVSQAAKSYELFHQQSINQKAIDDYYKSLLKKHTNIVFIGMPKSGKSLYSKIYAQTHHRTLLDLDTEFEERYGMTIKSYFAQYGESQFRKEEHSLIASISKIQGIVISTGGGAILDSENIDHLKQNGVLVLIDTPLSILKRTSSINNRPLLNNDTALAELYNKRHHRYIEAADIILKKTSLHTSTNIKALEVLLYDYFGT